MYSMFPNNMDLSSLNKQIWRYTILFYLSIWVLQLLWPSAPYMQGLYVIIHYNGV